MLVKNAITSGVEIALESRYAERIFSLETEVAVLQAEAAIDRCACACRLQKCCACKDGTTDSASAGQSKLI